MSESRGDDIFRNVKSNPALDDAYDPEKFTVGDWANVQMPDDAQRALQDLQQAIGMYGVAASQGKFEMRGDSIVFVTPDLSIPSYLKKAMDRVAASLRGWAEFAAHADKSRAYYVELLDRIGEMIGESAYIADDGEVSTSVLRAKLPDLVDALVARVLDSDGWLGDYDHLAARAEELLLSGSGMQRDEVMDAYSALVSALDEMGRARPARPEQPDPRSPDPEALRPTVGVVSEVGQDTITIRSFTFSEQAGDVSEPPEPTMRDPAPSLEVWEFAREVSPAAHARVLARVRAGEFVTVGDLIKELRNA